MHNFVFPQNEIHRNWKASNLYSINANKGRVIQSFFHWSLIKPPRAEKSVHCYLENKSMKLRNRLDEMKKTKR